MTHLEVLVVDDDPGIRTFLTLILQDHGFSVRSAENGKDALELIRHKKPHLILLDLIMPEMNGEELCSIIKKDPGFRGISVFIISAKTDIRSQNQLKDLGADEYLAKPIDGRALVARLEAFRRFMEDIRSTPVSGNAPAITPSQNSRSRSDLPPLDLTPGSTGSVPFPVQPRYGGFRVESLVGSGGMGHVFKGFDERLERHVAIKVLSPKISEQQESVERFRREAVTLAALNHPGIANIFLFGEEKGQYYFAMQWFGGGSLLDMIRKVKRIAPMTAIDIILQTARALEAANSRGVIHRDVKPSNIMFDENQNIKMVDFGLALLEGASQQITKAGEFLGSPSYVSPEQATSDKVDHRSDIYSLGITFFQMLYGRVPFRGKTAVETVLKQVNEPFPAYDPDRAPIPPSLYDVIRRMARKDPSRRYQKYSELIQEIEKLRSQLASELTFKMPEAVHPTTLQSMGNDLFQCFSTLFSMGSSGALQVRDSDNMWIFLIHQGEIVYFESDHNEDSVVAAFYRRGWLNREDIQDLDQMTEDAFVRILQNPRFTVRHLQDCLSEHVRNVVVKLLDTSGALSFRDAEIQNPFLHLKVGDLLLDYVRKFNDAAKFLEAFPAGGTLQKMEGYEKILQNLIWKPEESFILSRVEGLDITIDMLQTLTGLPEAVVARTVYAMVHLGAISWREQKEEAFTERDAIRDRSSPASGQKDSGSIQPQSSSGGSQDQAPIDIEDFKVRIELKKSRRMVEDEHHERVANQFYRLAQEKFAEGNYWKATELCRQAISNDPDEAKYHVLMAQAYARHPKFLKDAETSFLKALELAPWNPDYHFEMAEFYWSQGLSLRAWSECKKTLEILPEHAKGRALFQQLKKAKKS